MKPFSSGELVGGQLARRDERKPSLSEAVRSATAGVCIRTSTHTDSMLVIRLIEVSFGSTTLSSYLESGMAVEEDLGGGPGAAAPGAWQNFQHPNQKCA